MSLDPHEGKRHTDIQRKALFLRNPLRVNHDELLDQFFQLFAVKGLGMSVFHTSPVHWNLGGEV